MVKKILLWTLLVFVLIVGVFALVVYLQPADFRVERSAKISAPPSEVFAHVNDFQKWKAWSPWENRDPDMTRTFEGPTEGKDAVYKWSGNDQVGEGKMTILESRPNELVRIKLDFVKPYESSAEVEISFKEEGEQTVVNWAMFGENDFMSKAMCMFMDMDAMVGGDFEQGLANLKTVVEAESKKQPAD